MYFFTVISHFMWLVIKNHLICPCKFQRQALIQTKSKTNCGCECALLIAWVKSLTIWVGEMSCLCKSLKKLSPFSLHAHHFFQLNNVWQTYRETNPTATQLNQDDGVFNHTVLKALWARLCNGRNTSHIMDLSESSESWVGWVSVFNRGKNKVK